MMQNTIRYTATLPLNYIIKLKKLALEKKIPSVNHAINKAIEKYIKEQNAIEYNAQMELASQDAAFLSRTSNCAHDFNIVDSEVDGIW